MYMAVDMKEKEWMNECLTTPQLKMKIGYWVSDKYERKHQNKIKM